MRLFMKEHNADIMPSYNEVLSAKTACYPEESGIIITEISAEISLQTLLDHTVRRILLRNDVNLNDVTNNCTLKMITKWGCDDTSGFSAYKQTFSTDSTCNDEILFVAALVPLQISDESTVVWQNAKPSSPTLCRPIKFEYTKESPEKTLSVENDIKRQIRNLAPTEVLLDNGTKLRVIHSLYFIMLDGKVLQVITGTSSAAVCPICKATPTEMNKLQSLKEKTEDTSFLESGLSLLHTWIRFFECILHIAYKLNLKKWQAKGDEEKAVVKETKKRIQAEFKERMGLIVDVPKQGTGTSNDGNTARRFFSNLDVSQEIVQVNRDLIERFHVILQSLSSYQKIDSTKFREYCLSTAELFVKEYPWFYMPSSVHKVLIHGASVLDVLPLPSGFFSEESLEANNKIIKFNKEHHTRKDGRLHTMTDLFYRHLAISDPYTANFQEQKEQKRLKPLHKDALMLLMEPES